MSPPVNGLRRRGLLAGATLVFGLLTRQVHAAAQIVAVRVWPARDYTRVTLEHEGELQFTQFPVTDPPRLVVDIEGVSLDETLKNLVKRVLPNDPFIQNVRVGQNTPHVVRLVFDLKQTIKPQVFQLRPIGQYKHRLVFDLYPTQGQDPLMALIDEQQRLESLALRSADTLQLSEKQQNRLSRETERAIGQAQNPNGSAPALREECAPASKPEIKRPDSNSLRMVTIAIDPGHGGEDPGAIGPRGTQEKDVVLSISKRLKRLIDSQPGMRAMLTRDDDYFIPLAQRVSKARAVEADLFISVHADAFVRPSAKGASVFVLSERGASSTTANWLAKKENDADLIGGVNIDAKDPHVARTLLDLSTTAQIADSLKIGRAVLSEIGEINTLHKRAVEQAGFAVLKAPDIPSILVETAFISNPEEEARLRSPLHQNQVAKAMFEGIRRYFAKNPPLARNKLARLEGFTSALPLA